MTMPEWVAIGTYVDCYSEERLFEDGGIYHEVNTAGEKRELTPGEPEAVCPRCGQRFAATDQTPTENMKAHFDGDEELPSICDKEATLRHAFAQASRSQPCPCGSGKKFKRCHGADVTGGTDD